MKICADENVAPQLSALIREALVGSKHTLDTVDDHQARSVDDEIWVRHFAESGGEAIIGADGKMTTRPHEIVAIAETGLRLVILPPQWVNARKHLQIAFLFLWWPRIIQTFEGADRGKCFKVPWLWNEDGKLRLIEIDVQAAYKKVRKGA